MRGRKIVKIILIIIIGLGLLVAAFYLGTRFIGKDDGHGIEQDDRQQKIQEEFEQKTDDEEEYIVGTIQIPGYVGATVDNDARGLQLINPEVNSVLFKYKVTLNDESLFETGWIRPGNAVVWDVYESLSGVPGEYELYFNIETIDPETEEPKNGASEKVKIKVE